MSDRADDDGGQVSEVASLGEGPQPISDSQGVAGNPDAPPADEVPAGPNANPHAPRHRRDRRRGHAAG